MRSRHIATSRLLLIAAGVLGVADALLWITALGVLSHGPSIAGYNILEPANRLPVAIAGLAALSLTTAAFEGRGRVIVKVGILLLAAGITAGVAAGLYGLGLSFSNYDLSLYPNIIANPQGIKVYSLHLAMMAVGQILALVPVVLVVGAALVPAGARLRRWKLSRAAVAIVADVDPAHVAA